MQPISPVTQALLQLREAENAAFAAKLIPTIDADKVLGVRLPAIRQLAKKYKGSEEADRFLLALPHEYLEENHLHSFLIAQMQDFDECISQLERFLPFVDNWAVCDSLRPQCFKKHKAALLEHIRRWLCAEHLYTMRFGIGMLMCHFLDEDFQPEYLAWVAALESEEYYLNMMRAWYFATALAKQYESTLPLIQSGTLDRFTQNKAIQKACESFRVSQNHKQQLRAFRIR